MDGQEPDNSQASTGSAAALTGSGAALLAVGSSFDGGANTAIQIAGIAVVLIGAVLLGKAIAKSRAA